MKVIQWMNAIDEEKMCISAITVGEIQHGIERMPESHRKTELQVWLNDGLIERFDQRILALDTQTMFVWGSLVARIAKSGQTLALMDSLIVATVLQNNLIIVTRNVTDFIPGGVQVINPWE